MNREVSVEEISDGRLYRSSDLVKVGTNGCRGCSDCCRMDPLIVLDPWDLYQLQKATGRDFSALLEGRLRLQVVDGLILPVLAMQDGVCTFLRADGRCSIHEGRPGICRLYPLGRSWSGDETFSYILQVNECTHPSGAKEKVKKWIGIGNLPEYEEFCVKWHKLQKEAQRLCSAHESAAAHSQKPGSAAQREPAGSAAHSHLSAGAASGQPSGSAAAPSGGPADDGFRKQVCMAILQTMIVPGYDIGQDFLPQFEERLAQLNRQLGFA